MKLNDYNIITNADINVNSFAVSILRDGLLKNVFREDYGFILYWSGKELARQFPIDTLLDIQQFFLNSGFGDLELTSQDSTTQTWILSGLIVQQRFSIEKEPDFSLEAGFLAQQFEIQTNSIAEANFSLDTKRKIVAFEVITDLNQKIDQATLEQKVNFRDSLFSKKHDKDIKTLENKKSADSTKIKTKDSDSKSVSQQENKKAINSIVIDNENIKLSTSAKSKESTDINNGNTLEEPKENLDSDELTESLISFFKDK